jgi:hypothetical protein
LSTFKIKLHKPAPDFYEEPRPGLRGRDPLEGYRDRRHGTDSAFYTPSSKEQLEANRVNEQRIP